MSERPRCLVVDCHPLVRMGIRRLLGERFEIEEAPHANAGRDHIRDLGPFDVAIVEVRTADNDSGAPRGTQAIRILLKAQSDLPIVAHGDRSDRFLVNDAVTAGAKAYVMKTSSPSDLLKAVAAAVEAEVFIDPSLGLAPGGGRGPAVTKRQREILQLLADGNSTVTTAEELGLSPETVKTHTKHILAKLEARDRAHAVAIALRNSLID